MTDKSEAIRRYFEEHMPGYELAILPPRGIRPFGFQLRRDTMEYTIEFEQEFLDARDPAAITQTLDEWNLIDELCRGEGLRYIATQKGLRLDSSN